MGIRRFSREHNDFQEVALGWPAGPFCGRVLILPCWIRLYRSLPSNPPDGCILSQMDSLEQSLRRRATQQAENAIQMWAESNEMLRSDSDSVASFHSVIWLNKLAIEECRSALNTFTFLKRLRH